MKKITLKLLNASSVSVDEAVYCEFEIRNKQYKSKVFKSDCSLDQIINLGSFNPTDSLNISCISKRSGDPLATFSLSLEQFTLDGEFENNISLEKYCLISVKMIISEARGHVRRSSSIKNITGKFSRMFLNKSDDKKESEIIPVPRGVTTSIPHSQSHTINLNNIGNSDESSKDKKLTRTLSEENLAEKPKRRERRRVKTTKPNKLDNNESPKPKRKRRNKTPSKLESDSSSPNTRERRRKNKNSDEKETKKEKPEKDSDTTDTDTENKEIQDKPKKIRTKKKNTNNDDNKKDKNNDYDSPTVVRKKKRKQATNENENENENNIQENTTNGDSKRRTVKLQPIGVSTKLFGVELQTVMDNQKEGQPDLLVPSFFITSAKIIREKGFTVQGIFRIRGKLKEVKELKAKIDNGTAVEEDYTNIHLIATLMKAFFRELPTPILTFENYDAFIKAADYKGDEQIEKLANIMNNLPKVNHDLLKYMFCLLHELGEHSDTTQMTSENLAKVISPNLIWKKELDIMDLTMVQDTLKCNDLAVVMIEHYDKLFTM